MLSKDTTHDSRYVDILLYKEDEQIPVPEKSSCYTPLWQRFIAWLGFWKKMNTDEEERVSIIEELI
ncbi:MAG: hypothetical protein ACOVRN_18860 [Flavobacterium sp.]